MDTTAIATAVGELTTAQAVVGALIVGAAVVAMTWRWLKAMFF